jgi:succinoglycan biosynthesis protein ExoM
MQHRDFFYSPILPTGTYPSHKYAGNCIIKAELLKQMSGPFDPRYGTTGGEDTHLFDRLERRGARFVCCREAWVTEYLPPSRTTLSYLFLRGMKGGNAHTRRSIEFSGNRQILTRLFMTGKAFSLGTVSLFCALIIFPFKAPRTRWLLKLASNIGRLMAASGWNYQAYR